MIKIENTQVTGWQAAIRGLRNPLNSWAKSDSCFLPQHFCDMDADYTLSEICGSIAPIIGEADHRLMMNLAKAGPTDAKYRRMIVTTTDVTAPLYWWKEYDTYKVGTVANSCSTMHKIAEKEFTIDDFSHDHIEPLYVSDGDKACDNYDFEQSLRQTVFNLNIARGMYLQTKDKRYWWQMIQLLPSSYNQKRTIMLNYEVLAGIYPKRKDHKLSEWHTFCDWIKDLPYSEIITLEEKS